MIVDTYFNRTAQISWKLSGFFFLNVTERSNVINVIVRTLSFSRLLSDIHNYEFVYIFVYITTYNVDIWFIAIFS